MTEQQAEQSRAEESGRETAEQAAAEEARRDAEPNSAEDRCPGCVIVRSTGEAALGAVRVAGGAENVRMPRLPPEKPPPARASASPAAKTSTAASMANANSDRRQIMALFLPTRTTDT
ncbi:MAG: hypothetical protein WBD48_05015 [Pseudolabrys sp.]